MDYVKALKNLGWECDWDEGSRKQFSKRNILLDVCEQKDGYHEFAVCPKKHFDRWANSRHISFKLMVENYNGNHGWTSESVEKDFKRNLSDSRWLCRKLKGRMFDHFIQIQL